eukprot:170418-Rhodomonas_salina.1
MAALVARLTLYSLCIRSFSACSRWSWICTHSTRGVSKRSCDVSHRMLGVSNRTHDRAYMHSNRRVRTYAHTWISPMMLRSWLPVYSTHIIRSRYPS